MRAKSLTGEERLKILHDILNPNKTFEFSYKDLKKSNCKSKKDKGGILDLIFKKEPKRYKLEDTIPYLRLLKS